MTYSKLQYIFFFGNSPDLAFIELSSVLSRFRQSAPQQILQGQALQTSSHQPVQEALLHIASIQADVGQAQIEEFAKLLGGTIKVATVFVEVNNFNSGIILNKIVGELENDALKNKRSKIVFGISEYTSPSEKIDTSALSKKLKNEINPQFKVRFVLPKFPAVELSSVVIKKQMVTDISIAVTEDKTICAKTIWVQDFEDWGKRDYGRPAAAGHIGMLPPKVARMMVNLALPITTNYELITILDPFCGVGTIPVEALMLGANVVASDLDKNQVARTKENLKWLAEAYDIRNTKYEILQSDAPNISKLLKQKVDAIVTEPDLGPNTLNLNSGQINELSAKLEGLYLTCLRRWKEILKPGGRVVMAIPSFVIGENLSPIGVNSVLVKTVIDKAKIMGYSLFGKPFQYARPQARVIRNICIFQIEN